MCGIVGIFSFNNFKDKAEELRVRASLFLFTELLEITSARGEDATGVTTLFENGDYMIQKMGIASPKFISRFGNKAGDFEGYLNLCRKNENKIKALIGHCRKSSVGNTIDNENNHPIKVGEIVGIHNGTLKNHNKVFKKLNCDRDGVVDSEAIFRLIQHYTADCKEPFTLEILEETVRRLEGSYSCITYNANNPYQIGVFRNGRPMEFALIKSLGIMVIASEKKFIDQALYDYNKQVKLYKLGAPLIKSTDISFAVLPDDHVGIIDLTQKLTKETLLSDLVLRKDVFKASKLWQNGVNQGYYANRDSHGRTNSTNNTNKSVADIGKTVKKSDSASGNTKTNTAGKNSTTNKKDDTALNGKIFCKELNRYVSPEEVKKAAKIGSVEISSDKAKVTDVEKTLTKANEDGSAEKSDKDAVAEMIKDAEVIDVISASRPEKKEVAISVAPEIVEESKNSKEALLKYSSNKDLADDIEASDVESVEALTPFALANRIRKHAYENAFLDGVRFCKKITTQDTENKKLTNAQKVIRIAKRVIKVLSLNSDLRAVDDGVFMSNKMCMQESLSEEDNKNEITPESLNSLITEGDKRDCNTLTLLETVVKEEFDGKTNTVGKV